MEVLSWVGRSEEHTSELQSLRHLVCRLLLEKKKAELQLGSAVIRLRSNTGFSFLNLDDNAIHIQLTSGSVNVRVRLFFFFNDTATTEIYTLSLHDALPIWVARRADSQGAGGQRPGAR